MDITDGSGPARKRKAKASGQGTITSFFSKVPHKEPASASGTGTSVRDERSLSAELTSGDERASIDTEPDSAACIPGEPEQPLGASLSVPGKAGIPSQTRLQAAQPRDRETECQTFDSDLGLFVGRVANLDRSAKVSLLENHWKPPQDYAYPYNVVNKNGKPTKKYANSAHLEEHFWLALSHKDKGYFCKYCLLFGQEEKGGIPLKSLVSVPLRQFDDLKGKNGDFNRHMRHEYHKRAVERGKNAKHLEDCPQKDVANQVSSHRARLVEQNRARLKPIVETVIFCGRQNIALRGHRDNGRAIEGTSACSVNSDALDVSGPEPDASIVSRDGNFKALLRFRVQAGDKKLENHLQDAAANATYISNNTQNALIDCCKDHIQETILGRVRAADWYSVIFDETSDAAHIEQLSLTFRYIHEGVIREDFVTFVDAYEMIRSEDIGSNGERRLTGVALAHVVEDLLAKYGIDILKCTGIGTDSCSVMSSEVRGAVHELQKKANNAKWCPCSNHILNNALAQTGKVTPCRTTTGTMKKIIAFANASPKRHTLFKRHLGGKALSSLCETRWAEKHDGHIQFKGSIPQIFQALTEISTWEDSHTASEAFCLMKAITAPDFLVSTFCLSDVLGVTVGLSRLLQTVSLDLKRASEVIEDTLAVLKSKREAAETTFHTLFTDAQKVAEELDVEIVAPRTATRQLHRQNQPSSSPEEYYRRAIFIPLLDQIMTDLKERLSEDTLQCFSLNALIPAKDWDWESPSDIPQAKLAAIESLRETYGSLIGKNLSDNLPNEYKMWARKWTRHNRTNTTKSPTCVMSILEMCDSDLFPAIHSLLSVLATLPVSVASAERSFSTLRRLKTWLRTTMGNERLTGLALLHIHQDIPVPTDSIISRFARMSRRRLEFVL